MQPDIEEKGLNTEAELQAHLAKLEAEALSGNAIPTPQDGERPGEASVLSSAIQTAREDLAGVMARLEAVKAQAAALGKSEMRWADRSAHAQLGDYPYLKLAGAAAGSFLLGRTLRTLPLARLLTLALPLALTRIEKTQRRWGR